MGTSTNQRSPSTLPWKATSAVYQNPDIPTNRLPTLIWRAVKNQKPELEKALSSTAIFACQDAVRNSKTSQEAIQKANQFILKEKNNSLFAELGKRAIAQSYLGPNPTKQWRSNLFSEITNYMVSRDLPGYLGKSYRNKNISDHINFKKEIRSKVKSIINGIPGDPKTQQAWNTFVKNTLKALNK